MSDYRKIGRELCQGVLDVFCVYLIIGMLIAWVWSVSLRPTDDSDVSKINRSGMKIFYDAKTDIEYLASPYGGLIERKHK